MALAGVASRTKDRILHAFYGLKFAHEWRKIAIMEVKTHKLTYPFTLIIKSFLIKWKNKSLIKGDNMRTSTIRHFLPGILAIQANTHKPHQEPRSPPPSFAKHLAIFLTDKVELTL